MVLERRSAPVFARRTLRSGPGRVLLALIAGAGIAGCGASPSAPKEQIEATPITPPRGAPAPAEIASPQGASAPADAKPVDDATHEARYREVKALLDRDPSLLTPAGVEAFERAVATLDAISNDAKDRYLRANAASLLGLLYEGTARPGKAVGYYRHAAKLVPDDVGPRMALALALRDAKQLPEAVRVQSQVAEDDPANLENWLTLGQMQIESGDKEGAAKTYAAYEVRRKELLDIVTATAKDGSYLGSEEERVAATLALAAANDNGTALGLLYALKSDPSMAVRQAVAKTMGIQRLQGYEKGLRAALEANQDPAVREVLTWALAEVQRDPVQTRPAPTPDAPAGPS